MADPVPASTTPAASSGNAQKLWVEAKDDAVRRELVQKHPELAEIYHAAHVLALKLKSESVAKK